MLERRNSGREVAGLRSWASRSRTRASVAKQYIQFGASGGTVTFRIYEDNDWTDVALFMC